MKWDLFWIGGWICLASLVTGQIFWSESKGDDHWRTLIFTVLTLAQMANVFACRSERPFWTTKLWFKNKWLWAAVALTFALQLVVIYWHPIQQVFRTQDLTMIEFCGCIFASVIVFFMIEFGKVLRAN